MEHNMVKNSNFLEANQYWLFYKRGRGFEHGATENKPSKRLGRDLNMMPSGSDYKSGAFTARPHCLPQTTI